MKPCLKLPATKPAARDIQPKTQGDLNFSNRPVRTRMPGGVAGVQSAMTAPYADLSRVTLLGLRVTLCVGSSRLGMLDCKT